MPIRDKINNQLNIALKNKDKVLISTLRLVLAAIKDKDIASRTVYKKEPVGDVEVIKILRKMMKQRRESADLYQKAGRNELLKIEKQEIEIINSFLPKQLSHDETKKICEQTIKTLGASSIKDMGKIMGELKKKYSDGMDFSRVNIIVKDLLNQPHEVS